jgi:hypothetical protein
MMTIEFATISFRPDVEYSPGHHFDQDEQGQREQPEARNQLQSRAIRSRFQSSQSMAPLTIQALSGTAGRCGPLLTMSAATIDRVLREVRETAGGRARHRSAVSTALRRSIPIRTFSDWQEPSARICRGRPGGAQWPGDERQLYSNALSHRYCERWTECAPLLVREQKLLSEVLTELRRLLPFELLGFDTDNDSVFLNETVRDYCRDAGIEFTRCRPYRKNDQAFVEQKNGTVVRRIVGYRRLEGLETRSPRAALFDGAAVRELLPAVVQAGRKGT